MCVCLCSIAYPLYFNFLPTYLAQKFTDNASFDQTYRNYCIASAVGVVGPIAASFAVQTRLGRRYMMGISAIITGVFLFSYTAARSPTADLAFTCISGLWGNFGEFAPLGTAESNAPRYISMARIPKI